MKVVRPLRFLALGDSYTIGEGVPEAERWPVQLAALLRERGIDVAQPEIIATTGWTTDELAAGIDAAKPQGPYDFASLLIGVNNQYRGRSLDEYREQFTELLQRAIWLAGGDTFRVLVLSIPDWGVTPFAEGRDREQIAREIDAFNTASFTVAASVSAHFIDVTRASREAPDDVVSDGLHPAGGQYRRWAELAVPAALHALGQPG